MGGALRDPVWPLPSLRQQLRTSPTPSSARGWRTSGPLLASPLSTAPSSRGYYSCLPGIPLIPPKDFVPAAAARSPAAGLRSSLLGTTGIFTPVPTLQLSDPAFYGWQMFSSFASTPTAAPLRRPVSWPGPRLRPHPPRPLWCFLPDARIIAYLESVFHVLRQECRLVGSFL
ncbi:hypothetical protein NQZ68_018928 [Dissostichus eleginoides]|nr:hypothetical protein NQZ68_018928 [Dissostichus eleginoides]